VFHVRFDSKELNKTLGNTVSYSYGFLEGTEIDQIFFNKVLGEYTEEELGFYIDAQARINPESLHHVYEWGMIGSKEGRLFEINSRASKRVIHIEGKFLPSTSIAENSSEPFSDKANIMENSISIVVEPRNSDYLVFEDEGEIVFTTNSVYIANPGGDAVAGSFGRVVDDFFDNYFTNALLKPVIAKLANPFEFSEHFVSGSKRGKLEGIKAAQKYLKRAGGSMI
jgi:hypothetical protein